MNRAPDDQRPQPAAAGQPALRVPDPRMDFESRASAFAEAVAQRVVGQIRSENWDVSLQLDPANLGSMDINLAMRGTEVTANVHMANGEARAMLEAGLPRLKESLESYGLQLGGWSFGQPGSRAQGESPAKSFSAQAYRGRAAEAGEPAARMAQAAQRGGDPSRAVDLFV